MTSSSPGRRRGSRRPAVGCDDEEAPNVEGVGGATKALVTERSALPRGGETATERDDRLEAPAVGTTQPTSPLSIEYTSTDGTNC